MKENKIPKRKEIPETRRRLTGHCSNGAKDIELALKGTKMR